METIHGKKFRGSTGCPTAVYWESIEIIFSTKNPRAKLPTERYDNGGSINGNMARSARKRLLADIQADEIDSVIVCKTHRLSYILMSRIYILAKGVDRIAFSC